MIVFNIASMDITSENGPIEIIESSQIRSTVLEIIIKQLKIKKKKINLKKEKFYREHRLAQRHHK